jgi:hypothetical protein
MTLVDEVINNVWYINHEHKYCLDDHDWNKKDVVIYILEMLTYELSCYTKESIHEETFLSCDIKVLSMILPSILW